MGLYPPDGAVRWTSVGGVSSLWGAWFLGLSPVWRCFGRLMAGSPLAAVRLAGFFPSGKGSRCRGQGRNIGGAEAGGVSAALVREKNNAAEQGKAVPKEHANFSQAIHIFFSSKKNVNLKRKIHPLQEGAVPLIVHGIRLFPKWDNLDLAMGFTGERELSLPIYIRFSRRHDNNPDSLALAIGIFRFCPSPDRPQYSSSQSGTARKLNPESSHAKFKNSF